MSGDADATSATNVPMRILYLSWRDRENPEAGGAETFTERTAQILTERGHRVTIFTSRFPGARATDRHGDVDVVRRGGRFTCYLRGLLHAARHRDEYDVVLDVQNGVPFWSPLLARNPVVNITHHVHRDQWSSLFPAPIAAVGWFLESKVAPRVYRNSRYVTVSQATRADLATLGVEPERVDLVYSGNDHPADLESYRSIERSEQPSMTVLGRLVPHKQVELAIDVVADLTDVLPTLSLDIVGSGYWEPQLREHAAQRGVADRIHFHGFVEESTKHTLLARSWLMLVPSHKEGWGLIIVEAGLHGTPSIAFAEAGGPSESILHGLTGLLSADYADMRAQARRILQDDGLRGQLGAAARDHAHSFSWWSAAERLEHTLHSVLGHRARPDQPATLGPGSVDLQQVHGPASTPQQTQDAGASTDPNATGRSGTADGTVASAVNQEPPSRTGRRVPLGRG